MSRSSDTAFAKWLQGGLQAAVAPDLVVDGIPGPMTRAAVKSFQRVHGLRIDGDAGPRTTAALERVTGTQAPAASADESLFGTDIGAYVEHRVRVKTYGQLHGDSRLLVPVPSSGSSRTRLHVVAANALKTMAAAVARDLDIDLKVASAWRPHRWKSREDYEARLVAQYGSVSRGRLFKAFDSPHETGLVIDLGVGGLYPASATIAEQRKRPLHLWLVRRAGEFGWHPYKNEPWHWEYPVGLAAYRSGVLERDADERPTNDDDDDDDDAFEEDDLDE